MINARILVRKGLKADFDPTKMLPGEWAVSIDSSTSNQIVWMCFAPGVCKRMGTYEDFKSMISQANGEIIEGLRGEFEAILADVESVAKDVSADKEEVLVVKSEILNTYIPQIQNYVNTASTHAKNAKSSETNAKTSENNAKVSETNAAESAEEAKSYAEQALSTTPDGYNQMVSDVDLLKNAIVQTTDRTLYGSKEGGIKLIGIGGASEQKQYSGAQLLDLSKTVFHHNGATLQYDEPSLTLTKTMSNPNCFIAYSLGEVEQFAGKTIYMSGSYEGRAWRVALGYAEPDNTNRIIGTQKDGTTTEFSNSMLVNADTYAGKELLVWLYVDVLEAGEVGDTGIYSNVMVSTEENADYEPYVGGTASPNPIYPQEIESVGDSGSLGIKAEGKNRFEATVKTSPTLSGVTFTPNGNGTYTLNGTATETAGHTIGYVDVKAGVKYRLVGCPSGGGANTYRLWTTSETAFLLGSRLEDWGNGKTLTALADEKVSILIQCVAGVTVNNLVFKPMLVDADLFPDITYDDYEPYRSKTITIPLSEPLRGIGEVKDEVVCKDGVWGVLRRIVNIGSYSGETITTDYMSTTGQLSNGASVNYVSTTPTFEPFTDQTPFYGLESFNTVTYISTDSEVEPTVILKFAKTEGDAINLGNYNRTKLNEIRISELMALQTELAAALVAGSEV